MRYFDAIPYVFQRHTVRQVSHEVPNSATCAVRLSATYIFFFILVVQEKWRNYIIRWFFDNSEIIYQCEFIPKVRQRVVNVWFEARGKLVNPQRLPKLNPTTNDSHNHIDNDNNNGNGNGNSDV